MKDTKEEAKLSSSINEKIRNSGFVPYKTSNLESFKNSKVYDIINRIQPKVQDIKRSLKKLIDKPRLWISFIDKKKLFTDLSFWIVEAIIEGIIANWWTHKIFGLEFGFGMIVAHGFLIKQALSLYWRLKKDGQTSAIPTKN